MALPYKIDDEAFSGLTEAEQQHYQKKGDSFFLDVPGAVPAVRLNEFRENNIKLKADLEAYGEITAEEAKALLAKKKEIEEAKVKTNEEMQELLETRTREMKAEHDKAKAEHDKAIKRLTEEVEQANTALATKIIDGELIKHGGDLGLRPTAQDDLLGRGAKVFKLEEGKAVAYDPETGEKLYGKDGDLMSIKEWMEGLTKRAEHLFQPSSGGGSSGSGGRPTGGNHGGVNPWQATTRNLTEQGRIIREDPALAKRMAAQAGQRLAI